MVTDPVVVNAPAKLRATLSERDSAPDPNDTAPRLAMVLVAVLSDTSPFCVLNDSVPAVREPATDWLIPPVVASVTEPVVVNAPAKLRATLSVRISAPAPSDTAPRLVIVLDAALSVTAPFCVLNASVPAVTPLVAAWEMPALAPVIVSETDPVVLSEPARVSDEVLERAKLPEPNVTTPRLVIVFCEALSVAAPFCVLNDSVPTLRTPVAARVIAALLPAVAKLTDPVVASVPANVRDALFVRLRAPDPSDTLPRVPIVFVTDPSETSALCVVIDSVLAAIAPEADCVMPDRLPVVAIVTDPVVLSVPAKVRAALLVRENTPDPNVTAPRLVMVLDAVLRATFAFCVVNVRLAAVIAAAAP